MIRTNRVWVSKNVALSLLTPAQIEVAKRDGKVRCQKRNDKKQNGRWDFNLWDLLKLVDIQTKPRFEN